MARTVAWQLSSHKDKTAGSCLQVEIDMSKPRLRLVHCSNEAQPAALVWQRGRDGLRPLVLEGGPWATSFRLEESVRECGLELVHLGLLISCRNYAAFMQAATAVLDLCAHPEMTVPSDRRSIERAEGR